MEKELEKRKIEPGDFELDKYARTPIYEQVIRQVKERILAGDFAADDALPSVRALSLQLGVNPNTLQKAYAELERQGLCYAVAGNGRFVHPQAREKLQESESGELYGVLRQVLQSLLTAGQTTEMIAERVREWLAAWSNRGVCSVEKETNGCKETTNFKTI